MSQDAKCHLGVTKALIALGSNVTSSFGSPHQTMRAALSALPKIADRVVAISPIYATPCMPLGAGPDYVNAVAEVETSLGPRDLLDALHGLEATFERTRETRWGSRTMDLDLLDFAGVVAPDRSTWQKWADLPFDEQVLRAPEQMILPHPRMQTRAFVLVPLVAIQPDWRHPVTGSSARELRDALPNTDLKQIKILDTSVSLAISDLSG